MPNEETIFPLCRHIRTNGLRCRSAAVSGQQFCYFHVRLHEEHPVPKTAEQILKGWKDEHLQAYRNIGDDPMTVARAYPRQTEYKFPPLEDPESVQLAGSMLFHAIAQSQIHPLRARLLLNALHIVNSSMRNRGHGSPVEPAELVDRFEHSAEGVPLAPCDSEPLATPAE